MNSRWSTHFDAQKQFLANLEDAIAPSLDLRSAIKYYKDVLLLLHISQVRGT